MTITTSEQTVHDGQTVVVRMTGISDGSGQETNVVKVAVADLVPSPAALKINGIDWNVSGGVVQLAWDGQPPDAFANLSEQGTRDYTKVGGIINTDVSSNGDLVLSTLGFGLNSSYDISVTMRKKW